jgi:hypothetical protein
MGLSSFATVTLYAGGNSFWYQMDNKPSGTQRRSGRFGEQKTFLCHSPRSPFTILTELPGSTLKNSEKVYY